MKQDRNNFQYVSEFEVFSMSDT